MNTISKPFYFGSYLAAIILATPFSIGSLIAGQGAIKEKHLPFAMIGGVLGLYAFIVFVILIYKMWKAIPAAYARTTPGKAVGFLFIPVFNLYWWFQALWGWSRDWNAYAARSQGRLPPISEQLALYIAVFGVTSGSIGTIASIGGATWLGSVLAVPNYILVPIFIYQVCTVINTVAAVPEEEVIAVRPELLSPAAVSAEQAVFGAQPGPQRTVSGVCPRCGGVAEPKVVYRGNFFLEMILWLVPLPPAIAFLLMAEPELFFGLSFALPAMGYSVWRWISRYRACPYCNSPCDPNCKPTNRFAVAGLVFGLMLNVPLLPGILALLFGRIGRTKARSCGLGQESMTKVAIILGVINVIGWLMFSIVYSIEWIGY